jgi:hypothetical protein
MRLAAHQPQFMPWLGYFDKMRSCDLFVLFDAVQYKKNEWENRNKIMTSQGPKWLTVPVCHGFGDKITEVRINNAVNWKTKHLRTLSQSYAQAKCFRGLMPDLEKFYAAPYRFLSEINLASVRLLMEKLAVKTPVRLLSENQVDGAATLRLVNLCRKFGADTYLAGAGGRDYMDLSLFEAAGIKVVFQDYRHPRYQQFPGEFTPFLSALDLIFHVGEAAAAVY